MDAGNTMGGIEFDGVGEEVPVLLEWSGAVEVDGSSAMIGEEFWIASSARVEMAAKPPLLKLWSQLGPSQDCPPLLDSQMPPRMSDAEYMLRMCVLLRPNCPPVRLPPRQSYLDQIALQEYSEIAPLRRDGVACS